MLKYLAAVAILATTLLPTAQAAPTAVDFTGTVRLSNCSGSVVKPPSAGVNDPALVLSNGHCYEGGFLDPGEVLVNRSSSRTFSLLSANGQSTVGTLRASKLAYATMTGTDVTLYQLTSTYAQIQAQYGIRPLTLSATHPTKGAAIRVVSGYWKKIYSCQVDAFVHELHEGDWVWQDSVRYTEPGCQVIGGTSGSPVIDASTGAVVAVNNTINEDGQRCTVNNPCEVDAGGNVTVHRNVGYAEETYLINTCVDTGNTINLDKAGCQLAKP
ncbi:S1 family peptidase [Kutzneria kofuensis]|uniref:V8-like Glu-specific endopeptidase n=1 Tax=Kutzneria kofuensis TaxID=103725 RepID=A0A7W9NIC5_9PSEU|nr:serine protease [Kutzneria kofuensis]MBB5894427.1 V8-like Glu-specific endopeptidase [Kutzneria kofuensis]